MLRQTFGIENLIYWSLLGNSFGLEAIAVGDGGWPFRALLLREFIRYTKSHANVWFTTAGKIVQWYRETYRDAQVEEWPNFNFAGRRGKISDLAKL